LTGKSAEILVVDDPHKNAAEVHSLVIRDVLYRNFQTSLRTGVQDGGGMIIISTRWHTDDLVGRLLENEPGRWKVVSFPAIALEDEEHRRQGEALSPERYSLEALVELRESLGEYTFKSLFQQNPTPEGGSLLRRYKWRYWQYAGMSLPPVTLVDDKDAVIEIAPEELPAAFDRHLQSWDLSFTGSATSDYVCGLDIRTAGPKRFITDAVHERLDFSETVRAVENFRRKHPSCSGTFIENTANGAASIDLLEQRLPGILGHLDPGEKVNPATTGIDRAQPWLRMTVGRQLVEVRLTLRRLCAWTGWAKPYGRLRN